MPAFARAAAVLLVAAVLVGGFAEPSGAVWRRPRADRVRSVVAAARRALGVRYRSGGDSPRTGFDCSGLTRWTWEHGGDELPHNAYQQYRSVWHPKRGHLRRGDLLFFCRPIQHVAIYMGRGWMIEAAHSGTRVRRVRVYWQYFTAAGRPD